MKQRTRMMHSGDDLMGYTMHSKKSDDESDSSVIQLHRLRPLEHFIEAQVQENDTLQAIALRFYCSISELKRINHIHKDNEIHARRTIKVPVTPFSVLTESLPNPQLAEPTPSTSSHVPMNLQGPTVPDVHNNNLETGDFAIDCNELVMNSTLTPSVVPYMDSENTEMMSEDTQLLPSKEKIPVETVVVQNFVSQGADWGIKWSHLVCIVLMLMVVIPLVIVILSAENHEQHTVPPLGI